MIDMLVADENEDVVIGTQFFGRELQFGCQFPAFSAPVVKNQQRVFTSDRETAVIKMRNHKRMLHADEHLHGPWPIKIEHLS